MQERHLNRFQYFMEQESTTRKYVIPYLQAVMSVNQDSSVLEIGCGEGGNLKPFLDMGCHRVVGVDILEKKILNAMVFFAGHPRSSNIEFYSSDIYKVNDLGRFDIIIMRDVIEHIHGQEKFMELIKKFLNPDGKVFLVFHPGKILLGVISKFVRARFYLNYLTFICFQNQHINSCSSS
jgi:2-polyprenyl-3-methyl-5-hydroxy-6-metoxy-1,4-benzoquinol methylase